MPAGGLTVAAPFPENAGGHGRVETPEPVGGPVFVGEPELVGPAGGFQIAGAHESVWGPETEPVGGHSAIAPEVVAAAVPGFGPASRRWSSFPG